jgi:hypothetical protein
MPNPFQIIKGAETVVADTPALSELSAFHKPYPNGFLDHGTLVDFKRTVEV